MLSHVWDGDEAENQPWGCTTLQAEPYWAEKGCHWHCGIDIGSPGCKGKPFYAARAGQVSALGFGYMRISPSPYDGDDWYVHGEYCVRLGEQVARGQQIGWFSDRIPSGGYLTGPHLHFEVQAGGWLNNPATSRDPVPFLLAGGDEMSAADSQGIRFIQFGLFYGENAPDLADGSQPSAFAKLFHAQIRAEVAKVNGSWTPAQQAELDDVRATVHQHIADLQADRDAILAKLQDLQSAANLSGDPAVLATVKALSAHLGVGTP